MARTSATTRKSTSSPRSKSKTPAAGKTAASESSYAGGTKTSWGEAERQHMINVAAYYLAEQRGFLGGDPVADWLAAEARIDAMLKQAGLSQIH